MSHKRDEKKTAILYVCVGIGRNAGHGGGVY